jgi:hypothetical protein
VAPSAFFPAQEGRLFAAWLATGPDGATRAT